ncbi:MAG: peptidylprolyl isomerase [Gemmatimonadetes bacterium]|nr:peptidylprolyl isomerase [Gemmatimonadota bacterium]
MRRTRSLLASLALTVAVAAPAVAQQPVGSQVPLRDRIMAVVGEDLLLETEWREQTGLLAGQLGVEPGTPDYRSLARETFDQMVSEMVIVAAARRDTAIQISEERVAEEVDAEIREIRARFPSEQAFLEQLTQSQWGSLAAYRADLQERKRRELLGQAFLERNRGQVEPPQVTAEEVRRYWEENRGAFGARPETYRFEEIPVQVTPDEEDLEEARAEAERVLVELRSGKDFAAAARQYSDDDTADRGGDLGWFGRGRMVEPFEEAAFSAQVGELVGPVETPFGYHVLQVVDRRAEEARARHILVGYELEEEDVARAQAEAERIRGLVSRGADVDSLQAAGMHADTAAAEPIELSRDQLPAEYAEALEGLESGEAEVVELRLPGREVPSFNVVVSRGRSGGEPVTFEEMEAPIRRQLEQQKAEKAWVDRLGERVYVDIRIPPEEALSS